MLLYVNGVQVTSFASSATIPQNTATAVNNTVLHTLGSYNATTDYLDGYQAECYLIDGQALTPSSFGYTHPKTGVWRPKPFTGTYGTNGFYLKFSDIATTSGSNAGLGKDFSGNGNYWNTNNISVTAGSTYDAMTDSPTLSASASNYATLNPNAKASSITLSEGNLKSVDASGSFTVCVFATQTVSNKCYWEFQITNVGVNNARGACGVLPSNYTPTTLANDTLVAGVTALGANSVGMCPQVSAIYQNGATTGISTGVWVANDVVMIAYNNGKLWMGRNGTWANSGDPAAGTGEVASGLDTSALPVICNRNSQTWIANFGQRPFAYTPPTGFVGLNTYNLPNVTIPKGNSYMDATTYTGTGSALNVTNTASFKPDFVWMKQRNSAVSNVLMNSVTGTSVYLKSDTTGAQITDTTVLTSFNTNGFTLGTSVGVNSNTGTYVGWQWQAGQGTTSSNTQGSITSTVSVNTTAGFSIVTYTGTSSIGTVGHGLGVAPKMVISKGRVLAGGDTGQWAVQHAGMPSNYLAFLNLTGSIGAVTGLVAPTSTVFTAAMNSGLNSNGTTYVAYCWAEIAGFSKFGSYTGNGSADGAFVYTGFRPKFILIKSISGAYSWVINDTSRDRYNVASLYLNTDTASAEGTLNPTMDILSNGFKIKTTNITWNASGGTYIYAAFAENPFKYSLAR